MKTSLLKFRTYDLSYTRGTNYGNKMTLSVYVNEDNTIGYSFYGGWQSGGTGFAISNLQMRRSLPSSINQFTNVNALETEIKLCLASGVGEKTIYKVERLNEFPNSSFSGKDLLSNSEGSFDTFLLHNPSVSQEQREMIMDLLCEWVEKK